MAIKLNRSEMAKLRGALLEKNISEAKRTCLRTKIAKEWVDPVLRIELVVPVEIYSPQTKRSGGHNWTTRFRHKVRQQEHLGGYLRACGIQKCLVDLIPTNSKCRVVMTRLGCASVMDQDNLGMAFKHVRDSVAQCLQRDDRETDLLEWVCDQVPHGKPGIRIVIERLL